MTPARGAASSRSATRTMSIGELIVMLRADFPDISISKIRYLEAEGLVEPERTPAGYRRFRHRDVARLRYVLTAQRDHYLPLRVIKDNLEVLDRGGVPSGPVVAPHLGLAAGGELDAALDGAAVPGAAGAARSGELAADLRLDRAELLARSGVDGALLDELESYGLVVRRSGPAPYDRDALIVASLAGELTAYGLGPRHLRAVKTAADRELGLVAQVVDPIVRRGGPDARGRAEEVARELASLSVRLHAALVMAGLRR